MIMKFAVNFMANFFYIVFDEYSQKINDSTKNALKNFTFI